MCNINTYIYIYIYIYIYVKYIHNVYIYIPIFNIYTFIPKAKQRKLTNNQLIRFRLCYSFFSLF